MARPKKAVAKHRPNHMGFRVTDEVRHGLEAIAAQRGALLSDVAHEALERYVHAQIKKAGRK
jgi:predicted transcriptional regulator